LTQDERDKVHSIISDAGFWSADSIRRALTRGYRTLLIERCKSHGDPLGRTVRDGIPFGDVVAMHFGLAASFAVGDRTFELYQRRE
jgi:hypothetical protein